MDLNYFLTFIFQLITYVCYFREHSTSYLLIVYLGNLYKIHKNSFKLLKLISSLSGDYSNIVYKYVKEIHMQKVFQSSRSGQETLKSNTFGGLQKKNLDFSRL